MPENRAQCRCKRKGVGGKSRARLGKLGRLREKEEGRKSGYAQTATHEGVGGLAVARGDYQKQKREGGGGGGEQTIEFHAERT